MWLFWRLLLICGTWVQCQDSQPPTMDDTQRAAALAQDANKMYAQLQARWNAEAGISSDPTQQTLNALTSSQPASSWGGDLGNGPGLVQYAGLQQQSSLFSSPLQSSSSSSLPFSSASSFGSSFQQQPSSLFSSSFSQPSSLQNGASLGSSFSTRPGSSAHSHNSFPSPISSSSVILPAAISQQRAASVVLPLAPAPLPLAPLPLAPLPLAPLPLAPLPKQLPTVVPSMRPRVNITKAPTAPIVPFASLDEMDRAKVDYLKRFPKVSSTTQQLAIQDFFVQFEKKDFKQTALHFAPGSMYESNGITYVADLSEPASWVRFPARTRSKCRFVSKTISVMWVSCIASFQGQQNPESMEVTFNPAGFITFLNKLEPQTCSSPTPAQSPSLSVSAANSKS